MCNEGLVRQLRWSPRAFVRKEILTDAKRLEILDLAKSKIDLRTPLHSKGTNSVGVEIESDTFALRSLEKKLSEWVMIPQSHGEKFIVRRYKPGDYYEEHYDFLEEDELGDGGQRASTVVIFLDIPKLGGSVEFPRANYVFEPQLGDTLLYHNRLPNAQKDYVAVIQENIVIEGEKWTLTKHYREKPIKPSNTLTSHLAVNGKQ